MLEQDPDTQAPQPPTSTDRPARDKRRPYASLRRASPLENLNCRYTFDRTDGIAPEHQGIVCCYLALMYCEQLLKNPDFHPNEFFDSIDPRQEDASRLFHLLSKLNHYSEAWHLLPSCRFGEFLRHAFADLMGRKGRPWAVYKVFTLTHSLGLRLRVKTRTDGTQELVVQVYDPNQTRVHTMARAAEPQDWGTEGQAHDFLTFLCAHDDTPAARADILVNYFTALDPDAHIALYELRADAEGDLVPHDAPCPLAINWCTSPRMQMLYAHQSEDQALLDASITWFFNDLEARQLSDPGLLLDVPQVNRSVLQYSPLATNKHRPHMAIALNAPVLEVNGQLHFARPVSEDGDVDESDPSPPLVHCRHFALQYCRHSIHNPKFHPRELLGQYPVTQADPDWLDDRDERLPQFSSHIHLLPAHRFGEFLTLSFNEMLEDSQALNGKPPSGQPARLWRVFCATTLFHAMGLRLLIEQQDDGQWECVVSVYDPNTTNQQVKCRTRRPQDFADHPDDYDFLSFLIHADMDEANRAEVMRYFPAIDTGRHLQLYELSDLEHEHEAPQSLSTDWCTHTRVALIYAECAEMAREIDVHLRTLLPDDGEQIDPESLQALPGVDKSLLSYAMQEPRARALLAWERLWMAQPLDARVSLLRGESRQGVHVLACAEELPEHALSGWCRMAAMLPEEALRQVLDNTQHDDSPLICALHQTDPALITAVIALINQATASAPLEAIDLLRAHDSEGRSAMEVAFCSGSEATLNTWGQRVMRLPLPEARQLLAGVDRNTDPLWARLLLQLDHEALARLAECYEDHLPATAASNPYMALSQQTPLQEELHVLARQQPQAFECCVTEIAEWLPEATLRQLDRMRRL